MKDGLPENCQVICACAVSKLEEVRKNLQSRKVTILELRKIAEQKTQMQRLFEAASTQQNEANKSVDLSYETVLQLRIEEFKYFTEQQGDLWHLCLNIHKIKGITLCYT